MKKLWKKVASVAWEPIRMLVCAVEKLVQTLLAALIQIPIETLSVLVQRLLKNTEQIDTVLDTKLKDKKERLSKKELYAALEQLYYSGEFLGNAKIIKRVKCASIVLLEVVSFMTTYRGLNQMLSALHFAVPLILAIVIQLGLTTLASSLNYGGTTRSQKALLALLLCISLFFSYVGISETLVPYKEYAAREYNSFAQAYDQARFSAQQHLQIGENSAERLGNQYDAINQLISDAKNIYNDESLKQAQEKRDFYMNSKIPVTTQNSVYTSYDENGNPVYSGGGTEIIYVPDPDAKTFIEQAESEIAQIKQGQALIKEIETILSGEGRQEKVLATLEKQIEEENAILSEFTAAVGVTDILVDKCSELSNDVGSNVSIEFDLYDLYLDYRSFSMLEGTNNIRSFSDIVQGWEKDQYSANTGVNVLDDTLEILMVNNPSALKESADEGVSDAYTELSSVLIRLNMSESLETLNKAYDQYRLISPVLYAFVGFLPSSGMLQDSLLAVALALINDGLAVLIGLFFEPRRLSWVAHRSYTRKDLMPYLYPHFRSVILPALLAQLKDSDDHFEAIREAFVDVLARYLHSFTLCPALVPSGFCRFYKLSQEQDKYFESFCSLLLRFDLAKEVNGEEAHLLGINTYNDSNCTYILLSCRAEGWLVDLLGSASEMSFHSAIPSV